jgi:hypothetical protein
MKNREEPPRLEDFDSFDKALQEKIRYFIELAEEA